MAVRTRLPIVILVLAAAMASGGCVAAGLAAGPLMSAVQAISERAVERTVPADVPTTAAAVEAVLLRSGLRVEERRTDGHGLRLLGASEKVSVRARLEQVTARMTRLSLRTEDGGLVADRKTGEHLHEQVALALREAAAAGASNGDRPYLAGLAALEAEVQRLRSTIDAERSSRQAPAVRSDEAVSRPPAPAFSVNPSGVVTVPTSYGLPTLSRPAPSPGSAFERPPAQGSASATAQPATEPVGPVAIEAPVPAGATAPALRPVGVLTPASAMAGARRAD